MTSKDKKPVIEDIIIPESKMQELNHILKYRTHLKAWAIRKITGGYCTICGDIPTKRIIYDIGDNNSLVEYYCNKDFIIHKCEINSRLKNINF